MKSYQEDNRQFQTELVLDKNRTVTFKINALENFPDADIYINDRLEDTFYPISEEQTVTLNLSQGNYNDRFFITFNNETLANSVTKTASNSIKIITENDKKILVKNTSNLFLNTIKIYDLLGKQIFNSELQSNISEYTIDMENKSRHLFPTSHVHSQRQNIRGRLSNSQGTGLDLESPMGR